MAQLSIEPPLSLYYLKTSGLQIVRGGNDQLVELLSCPLPHERLPTEGDAEGERLFDIWMAWWSDTTWAKNPDGALPRWNSLGRSSPIWKQVREAANIITGQPHVLCRNCGAVLAHPIPTGIGTKHLLNHRKTNLCRQTTSPVHGGQPTTFAPFSRQQQIATHITIPDYTQTGFDKELVHVVIANNWSFRTVERPSFQRFIKFLRPDTVITSRYKFRNAFETQVEEASAALLQDLGPATKISVALDAWSASNHLSFLGIKVYYINSTWQLQERLLDFIPMRGQHTGVSMAEHLLSILTTRDLRHRLLAITADNASNNSTLCRTVQSYLAQDNICWSALENSIPCLAHVINLVVQEILQHLKLANPVETAPGEPLQRDQIRQIVTTISVPNSLRKVCVVYHVLLSQLMLQLDPSYLYRN
jgi:hypothetical protein